MPTFTALALAAALFGGPLAHAAADSTVTIRQESKKSGKNGGAGKAHSLTLAPFKTTWPAVHIRYEGRLTPKLGVDLAAGIGQWNPISLRVATGITGVNVPDISIKELEGALSFYPAGHFHRGMQLGVTVRHQWASSSITAGTPGAMASGTADATVFTVGPHIGWKRIWSSGFTAQMRVGAGYISASASVAAVGMVGPFLASDEVGGSYGGPMVFGSAGVGWSF